MTKVNKWTKSGMFFFVQQQIVAIKNGGLSIFMRKCHIFLLLTLAAPIVVLIRLLKPFVLIRIGLLNSDRIGHFVAEPEMYLCERDIGKHGSRTFDIFYHKSPVCNHQLKKMWDRVLPVFPFAKWIERFNLFLAGGQQHRVSISIETPKDISLILRSKNHLFFTPKEESNGNDILRKLGIPKDTPFICFAARDNVYLNSTNPNKDWSYHDYRDTSIHRYELAVEKLTSRGYYAFRMGALVSEPLNSTNLMIIDYAIKDRSDFLDIFLSAKCQFFLGDTSGICEVATIFRRRVVYANLVPLKARDLLLYSPRSLLIPKKIWLKKEQRFLRFQEIINLGIDNFGASKQYEEIGVQLVENTPEEIAAVALEMEGRVRGTWQYAQEDEILQRLFWNIVDPKEILKDREVRIGRDFLLQNKELLER